MAEEVEKCVFADIPEDIGPSYLYHTPSLRNKRKAFSLSQESYFFNIVFEKTGQTSYAISSECYRSHKKSDSPHKVYLSICGEKKTVVDQPYCSCEGG